MSNRSTTVKAVIAVAVAALFLALPHGSGSAPAVPEERPVGPLGLREVEARMGLARGLPADVAAGLPPSPRAEPTPGVVGGLQLWASRYEGPGANWDIVHDIAASPTGDRVFVTGESVGSGTWQKYATVGYDALTGAELWRARWSGPTIYSEVATSVAVSPAGDRVFVTGFGQFPGSSLDYVTIAYEAATGRELWVAKHSRPGSGGWEEPRDVAVSPDGSRVYVTGSSETGTWFVFDYATVAYDAATGAELWVARYDGVGGDDHAMALALDPTGERLYVAGMSQAAGSGYDFAVVAYDAASGQQLYAARWDGPAGGADKARALAVSPDGARLYAAGESARADTRPDYATVAVDAATGAVLWGATYDGTASHWDVAEAVGTSPDGARVYVGGWSLGGGNEPDYAAVAYDAVTGAVLWSTRYDGPAASADYAWAGAMGPGDRFYLTGQSVAAGTSYDVTTIALDGATGELLWVGRYDRAGQRDYGSAVAPDPLGLRVYTGGYSRRGAGADLDYVTVAHVVDERLLATAALGLLPSP